MSDNTKLNEAITSLEKIQSFDVSALDRTRDLGTQFGFAEIVPSAQELVALHKRLPVSVLGDLATNQLDQIKAQADADISLFDQILNFEATKNDSVNIRNSLIQQIKQRRDSLFQAIFPFITYSVSKIADLGNSEAAAKEVIKTIQRDGMLLTKQLEENKLDSERALQEIKKVAAEHGVSQQAIYFKMEAENEETQAGEWLKKISLISIVLAVYVMGSLFLHKWEWLAPKSDFEVVQFLGGKIIVFAFLAYLLILCARNYAAHKHNAVVNRHRQNALLTYRTLVEAGNEKTTQDIVLANAASCIFSPQETAFTASKGGAGAKSVLELMTKASKTEE